MKRILGAVLLLAIPSSALAVVASAQRAVLLEAKGDPKPLSDTQIRSLLIEESKAAYAGNCPCPESRASNGSRSGRRSAYSGEGGAKPLCYAKDVSAEMVKKYRDSHS